MPFIIFPAVAFQGPGLGCVAAVARACGGPA
jgi:hypothetical protein